MATAKRKTTAKKRVAKKSTARKATTTRKVAAKKSIARKTTARKSVAKKSTARKASPAKSSASAAASIQNATKSMNAQLASVAALPTAAQKNASEMMNQGNKAMRDWMSASAKEMQRVQDKMFAVSRASASQISHSTNNASGSIQGVVDFSRDNVEACVECGNIVAEISQSMGEEIVEAANRTISQNVELSKDLFNCRTLNDVFDLQSRFMKQNMEHFFSESIKISELMFRSASEASMPINERVNMAGSRMKDMMAA